MSKLLSSILDPSDISKFKFWEVQLIRKVNSIALLGMLNFLIGIPFFHITGATHILPESYFSLFAAPFTIVICKRFNYIYAIYWFHICAFLFFILLNLKLGRDSYIILFFVPVILSMVQLLGRKELLKHLIILCSLCLLSIIIIAFGFKTRFLEIEQSKIINENLFVFSIIVSFFSTIAFMLVVINDYIKQEELIKKMLKEKEILLAEVFHRVKNNLNIVTSILNLKKNTSNSIEVQEALEECRSRVFSMALVHQNIFVNQEIGLNFSSYIEILTKDIGNSLGMSNQIDLSMETDNLSTAIPCGIILNEIITNAYKYALNEKKRLQIQINIKQKDNLISIEVRDNGPGISEEVLSKKNTLGLELIETLSEQLGGKCSFSNNNGLVFHLSFKQ
jgi:two-component sensor histidine kinase